MADYIEVNVETLEMDIKIMQDTLKQVREDMKGMFDSVSELDTMWDGPANEAFIHQFGIDHQTFQSLCDSVDGIIDSMENAKDAYRKCEGAVKDEINRIKG